MINRRSILSFFGVAVSTPAVIAPQPKSNGTGEKRKYIMIVADKNRVSRSGMAKLSQALYGDGFSALIISVFDAPEPIKVIDLSNLPQVDLDEVLRLCEKAAR